MFQEPIGKLLRYILRVAVRKPSIIDKSRSKVRFGFRPTNFGESETGEKRF